MKLLKLVRRTKITKLLFQLAFPSSSGARRRRMSDRTVRATKPHSLNRRLSTLFKAIKYLFAAQANPLKKNDTYNAQKR